MAASRRAAGELLVSFGKEDLHILRTINELHERSRVPRSEIVRQCLRAVLLDDAEAKDTMRRMRSFSGAVTLAARSAHV